MPVSAPQFPERVQLEMVREVASLEKVPVAETELLVWLSV